MAKNFLGPKMPLFAFWQILNYWRDTFRGRGESAWLPLKVSRQNEPFAKMRKVAFWGQESSWLPLIKVSRQNKLIL